METSGKLRSLASQHASFLRKRQQAREQGASYPKTRGSKAILSGTASPSVQSGLTGFLGMGSRASRR